MDCITSLGKKHKRALMQREKEMQWQPAERGGVASPGASTDLVERFATVPGKDPVIGLSYVYEEQSGDKKTFSCNLCYYQVSNISSIVSHVLSLGHRLAYLKLLEPAQYAKINQTQTEFIQHHAARAICIEVEGRAGRGMPMRRNPVRNSLLLKPVMDQGCSPQEVGGEILQPKSLEDVMIIGARRILHLQQLMAQSAFKTNQNAKTPDSVAKAHSTAETTEAKKKMEVPQEKPSPEVERAQAIEDLKKTLLDDFSSRQMAPDLVGKIVESRLQLLYEYERRGVPFETARERVIQEEERWNLLQEFERQNLSFEEAEQRIDHRFQLTKMYEKQGMPAESARKKVLNEEVIHDFKIEFQSLGFPRDQAQKQAERRLLLLNSLEQQGMLPEEASRKVVEIEGELKKSLGIVHDHGPSDNDACSRYDSVVAKHSTEGAKWQQTEEAVRQHVKTGSEQLSLAADQAENVLAEALDCLARYRRERVAPEEAKRRVLFEDLPFTVDLDISVLTAQGSMSLKTPQNIVTENHTSHHATESSSGSPESESAITDRIKHFLNKLNAQPNTSMDSNIGQPSAQTCPSTGEKDVSQDSSQKQLTGVDSSQTQKEILTDEDRERLLEEFNRKGRLEIQTLLTEMLKMQVPPEEAKEKLEVLYTMHQTMRERLFPSNSKKKVKPPASAKASKSNNVSTPGKTHLFISSRELSDDRGGSLSPLSRKKSQTSQSISPHKRVKSTKKFSPQKHHRNARRNPSNERSARSCSHSPFVKRSRSHSLYATRSRSRSPYVSRSRSRSPYVSRSRSRSPYPRRSRSRSPYVTRNWSQSPHSPRRHSSSPADSTIPQSTASNHGDCWKTSVDMFLKQTGVKKSRRGPSGGSSRSQGRNPHSSLSRSRSRSVFSHSPDRSFRHRSRSLSSASDLGRKKGRRRNSSRSPEAGDHRFSRGSVSDRRDRSGSSSLSRCSSQSRSSFHSRSSGCRTRLRSRSDSGDRSTLHSGKSGHSQDLRTRRGLHRNHTRHSADSRESPARRIHQSELSSGSWHRPRLRREDSRSPDARRRDGAGLPRQSVRTRRNFSPTGGPRRSRNRQDRKGRFTSPMKSRGRNFRGHARDSPVGSGRVSSPSLSSSSSFSMEEERVCYPLGYRPQPGMPQSLGPQ